MKSLFKVVLLALAALSLPVLAQLSCTPSTPRTDPGTGFVPFGASEQMVARGGNAGPAWEWAIGTDTEGSQSVKGSLDWVSGKLYAWTLIYNGAGSATIEVRDAGALVLSRTWPVGMDAGNALQLQVSTNPSLGPTTTMAATVGAINGQVVSGAISQSGNNQDAAQNLYYFYPPMVTGFTATGTVSLSYASLPTGGRVQFLARAGTIACSGGNTAPTVSITAPAAGTTFSAPANITLTANAQDSDGTITQVLYFANSSPLGTATTSPYSVNWPNVAAGSYSLTAVATDNSGASTTSAALAITVSAAQAKLYYIHVDHLNTPRLISDEQQRTVWRWDHTDPFGGNPPDENPSGLGNFEFPLRFPGQYSDKETNLHYNYFRDYDPSIGRYVESDPIGLDGGVNTYAYAFAAPLTGTDPMGLEVAMYCRPVGTSGTGYFHCFVNVTCPPEGWNETYSMFASWTLRSGYKKANASSDDPAKALPIGTVQPNFCSPDTCGYEKAVRNRFNLFPSGNVIYRLYGPNSNSFVNGLLLGNLPAGAPGPSLAPGIDIPHPGFAPK